MRRHRQEREFEKLTTRLYIVACKRCECMNAMLMKISVTLTTNGIKKTTFGRLNQNLERANFQRRVCLNIDITEEMGTRCTLFFCNAWHAHENVILDRQNTTK